MKVTPAKAVWFAVRLTAVIVASFLLSSKIAPLWNHWVGISGRAAGLGSGLVLIMVVVLAIPAWLAGFLRRRLTKLSSLTWIAVWNLALSILLLRTGSNLHSHGSWLLGQTLGTGHPLVLAFQNWLGWGAGESEPGPIPLAAPSTPTPSHTPVWRETPQPKPSPAPDSQPPLRPAGPLELKGGLVLVPAETTSTPTPEPAGKSANHAWRLGIVTSSESSLRNGFPASTEEVELICNLDGFAEPDSARLEVTWSNQQGFNHREQVVASRTRVELKLRRPDGGWVSDIPYGVEVKVDGRHAASYRFSFPSQERDQVVFSFFAAIRRGDRSAVRLSLKRDPSLANAVGPNNVGATELSECQARGDYVSPLNLAISNGQGEIARILISAGADVNQPAGIHAMTPLLEAASKSDSELLGALLEAGASPQAQEALQLRSALDYAAESGQVENVRKLLKAGADPNWFMIPSKDRLNPARVAALVKNREMAESKHLECLKLLLDAGSEPPPLAPYCEEWGSSKILKELLARGADLEAGKTDGDKALWRAVYLGRADQVELLLAAGAKTSLVVDGKPLQEWARQSKIDSQKKLALLEQKG